MTKLKVMTIIGTRPEIVRLSRVMPKLDEYCDHCIVHTGQNYDFHLNEIFFKDLELRDPNYFLDAVGKNTADTIAKIISRTDDVLEVEKPNAVLILGDTNSTLSSIAVKRRKIPIFHLEAGNRCFDERVPEEINRRIVDHISDINLPYSSIARGYLLSEGFPPDRIIKLGSPMYEVINYYLPKIKASEILLNLKLEERNYFLLSIHREENIDSDDNFAKVVEIINAVASRYRLPVLVSTHPRTKKRIDSTGAKFHELVKLASPLGFCDYVNLQLNAKAVLSDSGTITEEASILGFAALNLRETHERPEGMEEAAVMMTGLRPENVLNILEVLIHGDGSLNLPRNTVRDYSIANVSDKVVKIVQSYTSYVNRVVWKKM